MSPAANHVTEPQLDEEERRLFDKGVGEFNTGYYFECHDTLEEMWMGVRGPARDFFQGLIQVSVAFYHLGNERYFGFDLGAHRRELRTWLERIAAGRVDELGQHAPPRWRFEA